jgi:MoxR-like ATPase
MEIEIVRKIRQTENTLSSCFIGREEEARVAILALTTKQHAVFIGEPGTAKSALILKLSQLVKARFFYYLLSRYTVPDEIIGAIDPIKYREGKFVRNISGKLPTAEIAFLDEIFKGSSETLNTILNIMNERVFADADGTVYRCPLHSLFAASNEVPKDSELAAFYDRFLIKHFVKRVDTSRLEEMILHNINHSNHSTNGSDAITLDEINRFYDRVTEYMRVNAHAIAKAVAQMVIVLRQHGIFVSDRTATSAGYLPRLVATYSLLYNADIKKAAIAVSKYTLPDEEAMEAYRKALDALIPPEIREAMTKLEDAKERAASGEIAAAKRLAAEAVQIAQGLLSKPEKVELYKDELKEIIVGCEKLLKELTELEEKLKAFKKR